MAQDDFYNEARELHDRMQRLRKAMKETDADVVNFITQFSDITKKMKENVYGDLGALYDKQIELLQKMIENVKKQKENDKELYAIRREIDKLKLINDVNNVLDKD